MRPPRTHQSCGVGSPAQVARSGALVSEHVVPAGLQVLAGHDLVVVWKGGPRPEGEGQYGGEASHWKARFFT